MADPTDPTIATADARKRALADALLYDGQPTPAPAMGGPPLEIPGADRARWDGWDIAKSLGSGLLNGGTSLVGLPGDMKAIVAHLHDTYLRPVEQRLGYQGPSPEQMQAINASAPSLTPTSQSLQGYAADYLGAPHEPQTNAGAIAYNVGQKLPLLPFYAMTRGR